MSDLALFAVGLVVAVPAGIVVVGLVFARELTARANSPLGCADRPAPDAPWFRSTDQGVVEVPLHWGRCRDPAFGMLIAEHINAP
jgi:hypothetical protein